MFPVKNGVKKGDDPAPLLFNVALDQNAGRSHNIDFIQEEIKRMKTGNASNHLVQNLLSSNLLRYTEIEFCLLCCMGVKLGRWH